MLYFSKDLRVEAISPSKPLKIAHSLVSDRPRAFLAWQGGFLLALDLLK